MMFLFKTGQKCYNVCLEIKVINVGGMICEKDLHLSFHPEDSVGPRQCDKELDELRREKTLLAGKKYIYIFNIYQF